MSTNGNANGHSHGGPDVLQWKVGLINNAQKYLTAETFGFKINASGQGLKKKQTWILEQDTKDEVVYIRSHLGRYISADKYGKVTCEKEADELERCDKFVVEYAKDGSGRWAFRNLEHGNYFGGTDDNVQCFSKTVTDTELWIVQLAIHPQVNLRNVNRKRYAVLCDDEIQCKEIVPWGEAGLVILHFADGKYSLKTCDNRFLHRDGSLVNELEDDAKFTLEIRSGATCGLAFKDCKGYYLTAVGSTATMKGGKNKTVGKDELFTLEDSHPQVVLTSTNNKKFVSIKQGVDLSANQSELCEKSTFQMEFDKPSQKWSFRTTADNKYWSLESFGGIQATCLTVSNKSLFGVESMGDGTVIITADNGNCLYNKQTGSILSNLENREAATRFTIRMINRPFLILKCDFGFVGLKSATSTKPELVCNKTTYGVTFLEPQDDGKYYMKALNNKYWSVADDNSLLADSDTGTCPFLIEFQGQSLLSIKAPNGKYLKGEQNSFVAKGEEIDSSTLWEY
ncbi:fascin-like [Haliotis rufescens]|uniref:fascin-like n=1 Tax=Haliotis rufescens TaxID=6454 RepID=UPI001EB02D90|nr:fascin-like [Haliotis rufescens]